MYRSSDSGFSSSSSPAPPQPTAPHRSHSTKPSQHTNARIRGKFFRRQQVLAGGHLLGCHPPPIPTYFLNPLPSSEDEAIYRLSGQFDAQCPVFLQRKHVSPARPPPRPAPAPPCPPLPPLPPPVHLHTSTSMSLFWAAKSLSIAS